MTDPIRVLLADDHPALRIGLRVLLEQAADVQVVGETGDGKDALAQIESLRPDVVVLDCELPGMTGAAVAAEARRRGLPTRVLALSAHADERYVRGMIDAGAAGYLLKEEAPGVIVSAVRAAAQGEGWFSPIVAAQVAAWARGEKSPSPIAELTERERQVLRLVAAGKMNKEIGVTLGISEKTVEKYVSDLFAKLNVTSRVEAAVLAVREGLV
ncbi:MAG: response regulator transcription factor [Chloroflexota bacterium]